MFFLSYTDSSGASLSFSIVDVSTGNVWSPSAKAFVPPVPAAGATAATDLLTPLTRMVGANWSTILLGFLPDLPDPGVEGKYLAYVHPGAGGVPIGDPIVITPRSSPRVVNVAVSV